MSSDNQAEKLFWLTACRNFFEKLNQCTADCVELKTPCERLKCCLLEDPSQYVRYEARKVYVAALQHREYQHMMADVTDGLCGNHGSKTLAFLEICKEVLSTRNPQCHTLLVQVATHITSVFDAVLSQVCDEALYGTVYNLLIVIYKVTKIAAVYMSVVAVDVIEHVLCTHHAALLHLIFSHVSSTISQPLPLATSSVKSIVQQTPVSSLPSTASSTSMLKQTPLCSSPKIHKQSLPWLSSTLLPPSISATNSASSTMSKEHVSLVRRKALALLHKLYSCESLAGSVKLNTALLDTASNILVELRCADLDQMMSTSTAGFTGTTGVSGEGGNLADWRQWILLLLKVTQRLFTESTPCSEDKTVHQVTMVTTVYQRMDQFIGTTLGVTGPCLFPWLPAVFADQDDMWIEALLLLLEISLLDIDQFAGKLQIQHHLYLLQFVRSCGFDHSIIIDLLTSPETCFLIYLTKYLKYTLNTWSEFMRCHCDTGVENGQTCLYVHSLFHHALLPCHDTGVEHAGTDCDHSNKHRLDMHDNLNSPGTEGMNGKHSEKCRPQMLDNLNSSDTDRIDREHFKTCRLDIIDNLNSSYTTVKHAERHNCDDNSVKQAATEGLVSNAATFPECLHNKADCPTNVADAVTTIKDGSSMQNSLLLLQASYGSSDSDSNVDETEGVNIFSGNDSDSTCKAELDIKIVCDNATFGNDSVGDGETDVETECDTVTFGNNSASKADIEMECDNVSDGNDIVNSIGETDVEIECDNLTGEIGSASNVSFRYDGSNIGIADTSSDDDTGGDEVNGCGMARTGCTDEIQEPIDYTVVNTILDNEQNISSIMSIGENASMRNMSPCEYTEEADSLDKTMGMFIRTRLKLEKLWGSDILQYDPQPLLRLLQAVEDRYESQVEDSDL